MSKAVPIVKAYWWRGAPNFGDALAPLLLKHFSHLRVEWDTISRSTVASVGSILEHLPLLWDGKVLGSGRLMENSRVNVSKACILALRGPLSARGIRGSYALGDPGLLADELVGPQDKQWDLGIVPHWRDTELVPKFTKIIKPPAKVKVINPQDDCLTVLRQIGACRRIVTSSLHGMIVADAFGGIPRRVELCSVLEKEGGAFKFRDYSASIGCAFEPGKMMEPRRWHVEDVKYSIYDCYRSLEEA
jgi:pyruvyltransferase